MNAVQLEAKYQEFMHNLPEHALDGIIEVDLAALQSWGLLTSLGEELGPTNDALAHYFHVIETAEKITLYNDRFVVWIVPQMVAHEPVTYALVGTIEQMEVNLELVFATRGVYNTSRIVLRILERFLEEIEENELLLARLSGS
ncbi:MAG: hypothetical protein AB7F31_06190 [Parachlamydiales bacterium]